MPSPPYPPEPQAQERLGDRVALAMSKAFREYTGTTPGTNMWNLSMEKTFAIVAPAAVAVAAAQIRAEVAEEIAHAIEDSCECAGEVDLHIINACEYRRAASVARSRAVASQDGARSA